MGLRYTQISIEERCEIARLRATGASVRQIAASLDRAPSTVARELKRNASGTRGYQPRYAEQQARARRWCGSRLERDDGLREGVLSGLKQGWSPEQVAGRLAREAGRSVISHETIYRFIYGQLARKKDYSWRHYLPRAKSKRGWRGRKGGSSASFITLRRPLAERPQAAADRQVPGHWEADLMLFSTYGQAVLALHERYSRLLIAVRPPGKAAAPIATAISSILAPLPPQWRQTLTFDNGTEFARHHELHALGIETFFCDTHAPWQKGGVENAIGRMRRNLPRKTDLADLTDDRFALLVQAYNHTPRKCLGYNTPAEVFWNHVLHFKCESTFPLSRERRIGNVPGYSSPLTITHDDISTSSLLPSSRSRFQLSMTGSPTCRYPSRSYSRIASSFSTATSRLTSSSTCSAAFISTELTSAVPTPRFRKAAPISRANSRNERGLWKR